MSSVIILIPSNSIDGAVVLTRISFVFLYALDDRIPTSSIGHWLSSMMINCEKIEFFF